MRCGCPQCGAYMVQREHGLASGCACPACLFGCEACMGDGPPPATKEELHLILQRRISEWDKDDEDTYF